MWAQKGNMSQTKANHRALVLTLKLFEKVEYKPDSLVTRERRFVLSDNGALNLSPFAMTTNISEI